jgi:hypothetical protein
MSVTIETPFQITTTAKGKKRLGAPVPVAPPPPPPVPRVARLMALAIHFEGLIRQGVVRDYADLAQAGRRIQSENHPNHEPAEPTALETGGTSVCTES